jgi:hypothetical protein
LSSRFDASGFFSERSDNDLLAKVEKAHPLSSMISRKTPSIAIESIDGTVRTVLGMSAPGVAEEKVWIWQEYGLPIREEMTTIPGTTRTDMKNIELSDIPDRMFGPPAGA